MQAPRLRGGVSFVFVPLRLSAKYLFSCSASFVFFVLYLCLSPGLVGGMVIAAGITMKGVLYIMAMLRDGHATRLSILLASEDGKSLVQAPRLRGAPILHRDKGLEHFQAHSL